MRNLNGIIFATVMMASVGLGISMDIGMVPIAGVVALISYVFYRYLVLGPQKDVLTIQRYLQESGISSEELANRTGISYITIEVLRGNATYSKEDIDILLKELGLEGKRDEKPFLKKMILFIVGCILLICLVYFVFGDNQ